MEVESDEEDEKQEKSEEPPSQLDQDTQVQDMDEVSSWEGQWEDFFPGGSCRRWSLEKGPWAPGKAVLAEMLPKFRSTEPLSNSSNKDVFIGEDLKLGTPIQWPCSSPRGPAPTTPTPILSEGSPAPQAWAHSNFTLKISTSQSLAEDACASVGLPLNPFKPCPPSRPSISRAKLPSSP